MTKAAKAQISKKAANTTTLMTGTSRTYIPSKMARTTRTMSLVRRIHGFVLPPALRRNMRPKRK